MSASLTLWQRLQSLFYPVSIRKSSSALNPVLELFHFRGRHILATSDAVYSDGDKYRPLLKAFAVPALKSQLGRMNSVLMLGTGLASAVHILASKNRFAQFTLVEIDALILAWAQEFIPEHSAGKIKPVNRDAFEFIAEDNALYDLIIVDIFFGREVPLALTQTDFLTQCKDRLHQEGFLILNYMDRKGEKPGLAKEKLEQNFKAVTEISFGINRVYIATA